MHPVRQDSQLSSDSSVVIQTPKQQWVIPDNVAMVKLLIEDQSIDPKDLQFASVGDCQALIKKLLLLALKDECVSCRPSPLAKFARRLLAT